jgi:large subunit ribosomal protein L41
MPQLKPYVSVSVRLTKGEERAAFGKFYGPRGLTAQHFLKVAQRQPVPPDTKQDS